MKLQILALVVILFLAGCTRHSPDEVVNQYYRAINDGDTIAARDLTEEGIDLDPEHVHLSDKTSISPFIYLTESFIYSSKHEWHTAFAYVDEMYIKPKSHLGDSSRYRVFTLHRGIFSDWHIRSYLPLAEGQRRR
jgi:hypothetical protein